MFLHQCVQVCEIRDMVGGQDMLQFQSVNTGSIRQFDIVMVLIVVELIDDPDPERVGVAETAVIDPGHIQVFDKTEVAFGFQGGIDPYESIPYIIPFSFVIDGLFPKCILAVFIP